MPGRSALQGILYVSRGRVLPAELRQRVCLQLRRHDGGGLAFDGDGGGGGGTSLTLTLFAASNSGEIGVWVVEEVSGAVVDVMLDTDIRKRDAAPLLPLVI